MKLTKNENWHVKAFPGYCLNEKQALHYCEDIEQEITRHCDSVSNTEINCDTIEYCEFCKSTWEEESWGEPLCCERAAIDWERSKYCYKCFEETKRSVKREGRTYWELSKPIRCERCKRWFCSACFDWRSHGMCNECKEEVEKLKQAKEHKKKFKGRRIVP